MGWEGMYHRCHLNLNGITLEVFGSCGIHANEPTQS